MTTTTQRRPGMAGKRLPATYPLTCGHTVTYSIEPATGDQIWCIRCDTPVTITAGRHETPGLHPDAPGYPLMRALLDATRNVA